MINGPFLRKYGTASTIRIGLSAINGSDLNVAPTLAAGDWKVAKDGGALNNLTTLPTDEGSTILISLSATEMQAAQLVIVGVDQTSPKDWLDEAVVIDTFGNASAQHPGIDLTDAVRMGLTALPNAVAAANGGLPTVDASNKIAGVVSAGITPFFTTAMTEAYSTDGSTLTPANAFYELVALLSEFAKSGTTVTVKKRDGSTTAMTLTLDDGTSPTSITRAS